MVNQFYSMYTYSWDPLWWCTKGGVGDSTHLSHCDNHLPILLWHRSDHCLPGL